MKILLIEPGKVPKEEEISEDLKSMQSIVGGTIQAVYPFEESISLICNDDGKLLGLKPNRCLLNQETGEIYDIIYGTFFLCLAPSDSDNFESLTLEQLSKYKKQFESPEVFFKTDHGIIVIKQEMEG